MKIAGCKAKLAKRLEREVGDDGEGGFEEAGQRGGVQHGGIPDG